QTGGADLLWRQSGRRRQNLPLQRRCEAFPRRATEPLSADRAGKTSKGQAMIFHDLANRWLALLLNVGLQSLVLCVVWAAAMFLLRRSSASLRSLVMGVTILALLALPFLAAIIPAWPIPWMSRSPVVLHAAPTLHASMAIP